MVANRAATQSAHGLPAMMANEVDPVWGTMTKIERFMLIEAVEESRLFDVVNGWVNVVGGSLNWNSKYKYVPELIEATLFLLERGAIEVWADPPEDAGEGGLLPAGVAAGVLAEPTNWWLYDPDEEGPPPDGWDVDLDPYPPSYTLLATDTVRITQG
jgi:hypothetical protein